ncbi:MAG: leucyl/phenylalanyl-tRNA--protein transferase [Gammaproteobacteria bacterium]|nr:MAG: leucyl/phenylalanyl-tRNA--protein transferase [Gammaproteobacteria bacterium]
MTSPRWLAVTDAPDDFPPAGEALTEPNGLLAMGGDLSPQRLLAAYTQGIFPWYELGQPILWWSPDPRAVLWPENLHVSRRLQRTRRRSSLSLTCDQAFATVVECCAEPRRYAESTWITGEMSDAYNALHRLGWAHSFEAWQDDELVGGLYGVAIGRVFFGESMFSRTTNASKIALITAVNYLRARDFALLDCQIWSSHLQTLGATTLPRSVFLQQIDELCRPPGSPGSWAKDFEESSGDQTRLG